MTIDRDHLEALGRLYAQADAFDVVLRSIHVALAMLPPTLAHQQGQALLRLADARRGELQHVAPPDLPAELQQAMNAACQQEHAKLRARVELMLSQFQSAS